MSYHGSVSHPIYSIVVILLNLLLAVYFVYTIIAGFTGAAPIPSRASTVRSILGLADIKPGEMLYDLGSGDGRILFAAHHVGARCVGFEINPFLLWYTKVRIWIKRASGISVRRNNFWNVHIGEADVITIYLVPGGMERLKQKIHAEARPGTRVIAAVYPFPDWEPVRRDGKAYLYIV